MVEITQLLLDYLQRDNTAIKSHEAKNKKNTTSRNIPYKFPKVVEEWKDFTYDTLKSMYGGALQRLLDLEYPLHDFSYMPEYPFYEIYDEDSLEALLVKWNHPIPVF